MFKETYRFIIDNVCALSAVCFFLMTNHAYVSLYIDIRAGKRGMWVKIKSGFLSNFIIRFELGKVSFKAPLAECESSRVENSPAVELAPISFDWMSTSPNQRRCLAVRAESAPATPIEEPIILAADNFLNTTLPSDLTTLAREDSNGNIEVTVARTTANEDSQTSCVSNHNEGLLFYSLQFLRILTYPCTLLYVLMRNNSINVLQLFYFHQYNLKSVAFTISLLVLCFISWMSEFWQRLVRVSGYYHITSSLAQS